MHSRARVAAAVSLIALALGCRTGDSGPGLETSAGAEDTTVVAEIGEETITASELDEWIRQDLYRQATRDHQPSRVYDLRARSLDRMIDERVIEAETRRRNVSTEKLMELEIEASGGVTEEEIVAFYEENKSNLAGASLDTLRDRIREYLETQRSGDVVARLRERANVEILLEPVRIQVAAEGPSKGPANAAVTIIEFSDFQCPYCKRASPIMEEVLAQFPQDVRLVYRHLPLQSHSRARPAAQASVCADAQGRFWEYHDALFENPRALSDEDLVRYAGEVGLDVQSFETCLAGTESGDKVTRDAEAARSAGISSTPSFLVNGVLVSGAKPAAAFIEVIEKELERTRAGG